MELKEGDRDYQVIELQYLLRSAFGWRISVLPETDGFFGEKTTVALKLFQVQLELPVTGICDQATWDTLKQVKWQPRTLKLR